MQSSVLTNNSTWWHPRQLPTMNGSTTRLPVKRPRVSHLGVNCSAQAGSAGAPALPGCSSSCFQGSMEQHKCTCGIVIVDHGSRRKASNDMLVEFCELYQQLTLHPLVEPAHMELAEPTIAQAIGSCVAAGAQRVVVAPYFLSKGRHIQDDIPALVAAAQEQFPGITCSIAEPIGIEPLMVKIIQNRVEARLLAECPAAPAALQSSSGGSSSGSVPVLAEQT